MIRLKFLVFIIFVFFVGGEGVGGLLCGGGGGGGGDYTKKTVLACRRGFYFSERAFIFELFFDGIHTLNFVILKLRENWSPCVPNEYKNQRQNLCWLVLILLFALWIAFFIATG